MRPSLALYLGQSLSFSLMTTLIPLPLGSIYRGTNDFRNRTGRAPSQFGRRPSPRQNKPSYLHSAFVVVRVNGRDEKQARSQQWTGTCLPYLHTMRCRPSCVFLLLLVQYELMIQSVSGASVRYLAILINGPRVSCSRLWSAVILRCIRDPSLLEDLTDGR